MNFAGKNKTKSRITRIILIFFMMIIAIFGLFPLIWLIDFSLAKSGDLFSSNILILPKPPQWHNYVDAFINGKIPHYFINSIIINFVAVVLTVLFSLMTAYAAIRMTWKVNKIVMSILLLGMMIPIHATLLPNFIIFNKFGLLDNPFSLLIPYVAFSLPQGIFIMASFLYAVPKSLEESALIDGCGIYRTMFQIVLPITKPAVVTIAIMTFLNNWNEFIMAATYLNSDKYKTLPFSIIQFQGEYSSNYSAQFAVMALSALPAIIVYILLNEHISKGITIGAVKG